MNVTEQNYLKENIYYILKTYIVAFINAQFILINKLLTSL